MATDLDGTVIPRDRPVSARTLAAFAACDAAGIPVVPVTGRPPRWVTPLAEEAGLRGQVVCANGAVVYDLDAGRVVLEHPIARTCCARSWPAAARAARHRLRPRAVVGFRREPEYATRFDGGLEQRVAAFDELLVDAPPW